MSIGKEIKGMNRKYLMGYMVLNYFLFGWFSSVLVLDPDAINMLFPQLLNPSHLVGLMIIPLCFILEGIISSDLKHSIVFLRLRHQLPGCRAFSKIAPNDDRIDMKRLSDLFHSDIPQKPKDQNSAWYSIYKKHSDKTIVFHAQRCFLLTRDLAMLTLIFLPGSLAAHLIWDTPAYRICTHMGLLLLILIGTVVAAQNYGRRFVGNVLVEELHDRESLNS